jgi:hypothetical protein
LHCKAAAGPCHVMRVSAPLLFAKHCN